MHKINNVVFDRIRHSHLYNFNLKLKWVMTNRNVVFIDFLQKYVIIYHAGKYKLYMKWIPRLQMITYNCIQILFQAFSKIQNDHMKPENLLHIKFVLSCMINNVVFYDKYDISSRASPFPNSGTPLGRENSLYDTLMANPWRGVT